VRALIQTEHHPVLGSERVQPDKAVPHGEVLSVQLTRGCCIDRLSSHNLSGIIRSSQNRDRADNPVNSDLGERI